MSPRVDARPQATAASNAPPASAASGRRQATARSTSTNPQIAVAIVAGRGLVCIDRGAYLDPRQGVSPSEPSVDGPVPESHQTLSGPVPLSSVAPESKVSIVESEPASGVVQRPKLQTPLGHGLPQKPQFEGSLLVSTQNDEQNVWPLGH